MTDPALFGLKLEAEATVTRAADVKAAEAKKETEE